MRFLGLVLVVLGLLAAGFALSASDDGSHRDAGANDAAAAESARVRMPEDPKSCAGCHRARNPGILAQWDSSAHAAKGV